MCKRTFEINGHTFRTCTQCEKRKVLNAENFYRDASESYGYKYKCKECSTLPKEIIPEGYSKCTGPLHNGALLPVSEFSPRNDAVKTVQSHCKACQCHKYYQRTNRKRRKDLYVVPGKVRQCSGSFCGGKIYPDSKEFFVKNGNSYYCKKCRSEYRKQPEQMEKAREYARKRYHQRKNEPAYRQVKNIRNRVNKVIKRLSLDQTYKGRKGNNIENIMGCNPQKLREHIENHPDFKSPLTWENYGQLWHLDHIRPVASFNLNDPIDFFTCFHYKNLRPCLSEENLKKRDKKTKLEEEPSFSHEDFRGILSRAKNVQNKGKEAGKVLLTLSST